MIELRGKYNTAKVFTDNVDSETISQVISLLNQDFVSGCKIRIMPDCHAGAGCVIGFTADLGEKVIPNIAGVDIGCGMLVVELGKINIDLEELDKVIRQYVPSGMSVHKDIKVEFNKFKDLHCYNNLKKIPWLEKSIGTLGGGNHFIEVNKDENGNLYLVIHTGSRNLGKQVAEYYQDMAVELLSGKDDLAEKKAQLIKEYKQQGKQKLIQTELKKLEEEYRKKQPKYPKDLCFLTGVHREKYLHDMKICQEFANLNRVAIANTILKHMFDAKLEDFSHFETIHNYINFTDNIIRKGAISAYKGEKVLIPMNMRDGSLLCVGKGNPDWNYSAPHGAGRIMSRAQAKQVISIEEYKKSMEGIYTTSVDGHTIDEAPMVYKPMHEIIENIQDTVESIKILKPIYNFKAGE